jgi:hypothetical protein
MDHQSDNNYRANLNNISVQQGCTGLTGDFANCCNDNGSSNPLCQALRLGNMATHPPLSCMINLIDKHMTTGTLPNDQQRQAAYEAFTNVTGYDPYANASGSSNSADEIASINAFYMYMPTAILLLVAIWVMVGHSWISWPVGLFLTIFLFLIYYLFSIMYRIQMDQISKRNSNSDNEYKYLQSVALWPQGMLAAACAVTSNSGDNPDYPWTNNDNNLTNGNNNLTNGNNNNNLTNGNNNNNLTNGNNNNLTNGTNIGVQSNPQNYYNMNYQNPNGIQQNYANLF